MLLNSFALAENAGVINSRYIIHEDTVYDKTTNLTWQRCSIGQVWADNIGCQGKTLTFTFDDAKKQAITKWRLPTETELLSLVDQDRKAKGLRPAIDIEAFPNTTELTYWSGSTYDRYSSWAVLFAKGDINGKFFLGAPFAVRLVRSGN